MINGDLTGSRGRGRGNWNQPANVPRELRRPHNSAGNENTEITEEKPKSTLSAEAKEWFPANYVPPTQQNFYPRQSTGVYHVQQNNYDNADSHYYGGHSNYQRGGYDQYHYRAPRYSAQDRIRQNQHQGEYELHDSIAKLINVMCEVTFSPGKFAVLSGPLVDSFTETLDDFQHTQPLVDAIVNQAIGEPNFRYNGARLCTMFDSVEPKPHAPSVFRTCLLERCAAEEAKIVAGGESSEDNICGFAMFLAELYMQLDDPQGGRIKALGESLCNVLKHLLTTPNNQSAKAVCQILKLSGLALDADCCARMDELCSALLACERAGVQTLLVRNILNLRRDRWGSARFAEMADSEATTPPVIQNAQPPQLAGPAVIQGNNGSRAPPPAPGPTPGLGMFYLPDGHNLTSEEAAFLQCHLPSIEQPSSGDEEDAPDDSDGEIWEPEMDAEQRADFLEFLKMSNQITRPSSNATGPI